MARSIFTTDHGHTVKRATRGVETTDGLLKTLKFTDKERAVWDQIAAYWRAQLGFAEKKGRK